jgi:hypothetical protein
LTDDGVLGRLSSESDVSDAVSGVIDGAVRQSNDGLLLKRASVIIS